MLFGIIWVSASSWHSSSSWMLTSGVEDSTSSASLIFPVITIVLFAGALKTNCLDESWQVRFVAKGVGSCPFSKSEGPSVLFFFSSSHRHCLFNSFLLWGTLDGLVTVSVENDVSASESSPNLEYQCNSIPIQSVAAQFDMPLAAHNKCSLSTNVRSLLTLRARRVCSDYFLDTRHGLLLIHFVERRKRQRLVLWCQQKAFILETASIDHVLSDKP